MKSIGTVITVFKGIRLELHCSQYNKRVHDHRLGKSHIIFGVNKFPMNVQTEKSLLIDLLQNINDISLIQKVKDYLTNN